VVLGELGQGRRGRVLRAYDPKLHREVAIKDVHGPSFDPVGAQRIVREARAMAKLSHPNVVAVYDVVELDADRVVLVMEYVPGSTLASWLRQASRSWREIVWRFREAGRGLAAAHEVGLLHRDFGPANVLVSNDVVKVTEFGIAELDDQLTPADDQHAFCVALREALQSEPPPTWIAEAILRGLAPEPAQRWPNMAMLVEALGHDPRQRRNRVLVAVGTVAVIGLAAAGWQQWAAARGLRCKDAADKLVGAWDDPRRAEVEAAMLGVDAPYAAHVWTQTAGALDAYAAEWTAMHTEVCEATSVRGEQSHEVMDLRMACLHRAKVGIDAVAAVLSTADTAVVEHADELVAGLQPLSRCADLLALRASVPPPLPRDAEKVEAIRGAIAAAWADLGAGRYREALATIEQTKPSLDEVDYAPARIEIALVEGHVREQLGEYAIAETVLREALELAASARQLPELGEAARELIAVVAHHQHRFDDGIRYFDLAQGLARGDPLREANLLDVLSGALLGKGDYDAAETSMREALALRESAYGAEDPRLGMSHNNLALCLQDQGRNADAEAELRRALALRTPTLGPDHPEIATTRANLGAALFAEGKFSEAELETRASIAVLERALGPDNIDLAESRNNLGLILHELGRSDEAESELRKALASRKAILGADHPDVAASLVNLGMILRALGKYDAAEATLREALAVLEQKLGPDHPVLAVARNGLAGVLAMKHDLAGAEAEYRRALRVMEAALGDDHIDVATIRTNLARVLVDRGDFAGARPLAEQAWRVLAGSDVGAGRRGAAAFVLARAVWDVDRARARELAETAARAYANAAGPDLRERELVRAWLEAHPLR
jgi:serine/threonine-protein kinase